MVGFGFLTALPFVLAVVLLFCWRGRRDLSAVFAQGAGWLSLWALTGLVFQLWWIFGSGQRSYSVEVGEFLVVSPLAWWVHLGGHTVQAVFEESARSVMGQRQTTMLDNWPYYYILVLVQTSALAALVAWRLRRGRGFRDPVVLAGAAFVVANAWFGRGWPWWGS